jgi:hypothetical protein
LRRRQWQSRSLHQRLGFGKHIMDVKVRERLGLCIGLEHEAALVNLVAQRPLESLPL